MGFNPEGKIEWWNGAPILVENSIPGDPVLLQRIDGWRNKFQEWGQTVLGVATDVFVQGNCKLSECSMGNMVADAMLEIARSSKGDDGISLPFADLAFINGGGIRSGLPTGNITVEMIMTTSPFGNRLVQALMSGREILTILEVVSVKVNQGKPVTSNIQISGMRYSFDSSRPAGEPRVITAEFQSTQGWREIKAEDMYWVASLDFVLGGGDNIVVKDENRIQFPLETLDAILMEYVVKKGVLSPYLDGRIKDVAAVKDERFQVSPPIWPASTPEYIKAQYPGGFEEMVADNERLRRGAGHGVQFDAEELEENSVFENRETQQDVLA